MAKKSTRTRHPSRATNASKAKPALHTQAEGSVLNSSKVAVFAFEGDDYAEPVRAEVVRLLKAKGIKVETTLRAPDTREQFREMAAALNLAVYVHGRILDSGPTSAVATVTIRNGVSGRRIATARFNGQRRQLPAVVEQDLWRKVGPAFSRVCVAASKAGQRHYRTMRIEAGIPIEDMPRPLAGP